MAFGIVRKKRRLVNPGRRRRRKKMTAKQIRFFGTKAQRAGLKRRRSNTGRRRKRNAPRPWKALYRKRYPSAKKRRRHNPRRRRRTNVGSIMVATIPGLNPGRKRRKKNSMAAHRRRRRKVNAHRRRHYRRHNPVRVHRRRHYTVRRRHHNRGRRRNPGLGGDATVVAGIISGAAVTRLLVGFVPATWNTGIPGYIVAGIAAVLQGQVVAKAFKKPAFGKYMTWGGLTYLGLKIINDFMPTLGAYTGFGVSGLGLTARTDGFFNPQVYQFGSMGRVQLPNSVATMIQASQMKAGVHGLPRIGRVQ